MGGRGWPGAYELTFPSRSYSFESLYIPGGPPGRWIGLTISWCIVAYSSELWAEEDRGRQSPSASRVFLRAGLRETGRTWRGQTLSDQMAVVVE